MLQVDTDPNQNRGVRFDESAAAEMDRTAVEIFAPVYPVIAEEIVRRLDIPGGQCVEIGRGPGLLSLALAHITALQMILLNAAMPMHIKAERHLSASGLGRRFALVCGDVNHIPLEDNSIHLAVSRGSIFFWDHPEHAFREVHRILAPEGRSYIGGGFGNAILRDRICEKMTAIKPEWCNFRDRNLGKQTWRRLLSPLHRAAIPHEMINDDSGVWIVVKKE